MKPYSEKDMIRLLKDNGFLPLRSGRHSVFSNGQISIPVPLGHKFISPGVVRQILKAINCSASNNEAKAV